MCVENALRPVAHSECFHSVDLFQGAELTSALDGPHTDGRLAEPTPGWSLLFRKIPTLPQTRIWKVMEAYAVIPDLVGS